MIIYINTVSNTDIEIKIKVGEKIFSSGKISVARTQAEKLLVEIEKLLKKNKFKLKDIEGIEVENYGGSFTSLRIGVVTANALGFALGVPVKGTHGEAKHLDGFDVVAPAYDREPEIGK